MLIGVVVVFLVCQLPQALQHLYVVYFGTYITLKVNIYTAPILPYNSGPSVADDLPSNAMLFSAPIRIVTKKSATSTLNSVL